MTRRAPTTAATLALDRSGLVWTPRPYDHDPADPHFGAEAARALGLPEARVFKTLVAEADGRPVVAVVPVSCLLDLKALAAAVGAKRAVMASPALAERKTGYVVGGISPFGQRTRLPVVVDASAAGFETVLVSGGRRGFDVEVAPADLVRETGATLAGIGTAR